jgi:peptide/nickel transport system permease protein
MALRMNTKSAATHPDAALGAGPRFGTLARRVLRNPVVRVIARRLSLAVPLMFAVSLLSFILSVASPTDPVEAILGFEATPAQKRALAHQFLLDRAFYDRYWIWLHHALSGDLGSSWFLQQPVVGLIEQRLPVTLSLVVPTLVVAVVVGVFAGITSAVRGGVLGRSVDSLALVGFAVPGFWVGAVLMSIFAVRLGWLPAINYVPFTQSLTGWARSIVMPVVALSLLPAAVMARQTREAMMDVLASEHVRMAWANGFPAGLIYYRLALKIVSVRVVTVAGLQVIGLLAGTLFVEQVFALPGLGSGLVTAVAHGDQPIVQGIIVFFTLLIVGVNLVVDLLYAVLDPRLRTS